MVDESKIEFNEDNYHFSLNTQNNVLDITSDIKRADKLKLVPWFDIERENYRLSSEMGHTPGQSQEPLSESTIGAFTDQIFHDPLGAPLDALDKGVSEILKSSGVQVILVIAAIGVGIYAYKTLK